MLKAWLFSALVALAFVTTTRAADVEAWQTRGSVSWQHPGGEIIDGVFADTRVDDDVLRVIHEQSSGRYFMEMTLIGSGRLAEPAHFFVLDKASTTGARKAHQISASVLTGTGNVSGTVVSELSVKDLELLTQNSGNFMGATYVSRASQSSEGSWKTYYFLGEAFARAVDKLAVSPSPSVGDTLSQSSDNSAPKPEADENVSGNSSRGQQAVAAKGKPLPGHSVQLGWDENRHANWGAVYIMHGKERFAGPFDHVFRKDPTDTADNETRQFVIGMCETSNPDTGMWVRLVVGMTMEVIKEWRGVCLKATFLKELGVPIIHAAKSIRNVSFESGKTMGTYDNIFIDANTYEVIDQTTTTNAPLCPLDPRLPSPEGPTMCQTG